MPYLGRKVKVAKMVKSLRFLKDARIFGVVVVLGVALFLTACGGGGGSSATTSSVPAVLVTGSLSASSSTCTIPVGLPKCTVTANVSTTNATSAQLVTSGGAVVSTTLSGNVIVDVFSGTNTYSLISGGKTLGSVTVTGACVSGTASSGTMCVSPVTATLAATSPVLNGGVSTLTFGYTGGTPTSCTASSANYTTGGLTSGTVSSSALTSNTTFTYTCTNANGPTTATAVVSICAPGQTIVVGVCTTPVAITCPGTSVKHASVNACIYPMGVQLAIPVVELPASITQVTDAAFLQATVTGEALIVDTGAKAVNILPVSDQTRAIVFGIYRTGGFYVKKKMWKDTLQGIGGNDALLANALVSGNSADRFLGVADGLLYRGIPAGNGNTCYLASWNLISVGFGITSSNACPVWN